MRLAMDINSEVATWLKMLDNQSSETISLFSFEYNQLRKLAPISPTRVIKTPRGEARLFFIERVMTIQILKDIYSFKTKEEATQDLSLLMES